MTEETGVQPNSVTEISTPLNLENMPIKWPRVLNYYRDESLFTFFKK